MVKILILIAGISLLGVGLIALFLILPTQQSWQVFLHDGGLGITIGMLQLPSLLLSFGANIAGILLLIHGIKTD